MKSKTTSWEGTQPLCSVFTKLREYLSPRQTKLALICSAFKKFELLIMTYFVLHYGKRQLQCLPVSPETKPLADKKKCLALQLLLTTVFERDYCIISAVDQAMEKMSAKSLCLVILLFARTVGVKTYFRIFNPYYNHNIVDHSSNSH